MLSVFTSSFSFLLLQSYTFQAVITTDGEVSFAIFLYMNDVTTLRQLTQIGFNAGDGEHLSNVPLYSIENVNIYRIDGMIIDRGG